MKNEYNLKTLLLISESNLLGKKFLPNNVILDYCDDFISKIDIFSYSKEDIVSLMGFEIDNKELNNQIADEMKIRCLNLVLSLKQYISNSRTMEKLKKDELLKNPFNKIRYFFQNLKIPKYDPYCVYKEVIR